MENKTATLTTYEIRCAINSEVALGKMTEEEKNRIFKLLGIEWREEEAQKNNEEYFIKELQSLFNKYDLMLHVDGMSNMGRVEFISSKLGKFYYFPDGYNHILEKDISLLPKINKRREMFNKINLNDKVHINELKPILSAITRVDSSSWYYVTEKDYKEMLEALKNKYNLY